MPLIDIEKIANKHPPLSDETLKRFLMFCERRKFPKKGIVFRDADEAKSLFPEKREPQRSCSSHFYSLI